MVNDSVEYQPEAKPAAGQDARTERYRLLLRGIAVLLVLTIPILVLVTHPIQASSVAAAPPQAAQSPIAALEERMQKNPTAGARIDLASAYIRLGDSTRPLPLLLSVVGEDPKNAIAWNDLCVVYTLRKSYPLAIEACQKAIAIAPEFQLAKNNLAWARSEQAHPTPH